MYKNIKRDHGPEIIEEFLAMHKDKLPGGFPRQLIIRALYLVMKNYVFEFRSSHFKQLSGTAMGTSPARIYTAMHCMLHEINQLLNKFAEFLLIYVR
ncbi:hypothetical protein ACHAWF_006723 [Thalassiosira exigua]